MEKPELEYFNQQPIKRLNIPNGDRIVVTFSWDGSEPKEELYDANHNVYRLNPQGEIIWQVQRDDSILPIDLWKVRHKIAKEDGYDGYRQPFSYIDLLYPNGKRISSDGNGDGTDILTWEEGCIIRLSGQQNTYVLDPHTGIATCVAKSSLRYWDIERVYMPNGDKIILKYSKFKEEPRKPYYESNFNLYRLTPSGEAVWYVKKDDDFMMDWWEEHQQLQYDEYSKEHDPSYTYTPFAHIALQYKDGSQSVMDEHKDKTNIVTWKEGCTIYLKIVEDVYILDPNTGVITMCSNPNIQIDMLIRDHCKF
ncbi:hypothetical protein [Arcobacter sp.]|uniref:hypothetical protein n=1 Tax=Arcobacter sp. TaxID=1872629 RepID=UPI003D0EBBB3